MEKHFLLGEVAKLLGPQTTSNRSFIDNGQNPRAAAADRQQASLHGSRHHQASSTFQGDAEMGRHGIHS